MNKLPKSISFQEIKCKDGQIFYRFKAEFTGLTNGEIFVDSLKFKEGLKTIKKHLKIRKEKEKLQKEEIKRILDEPPITRMERIDLNDFLNLDDLCPCCY